MRRERQRREREGSESRQGEGGRLERGLAVLDSERAWESSAVTRPWNYLARSSGGKPASARRQQPESGPLMGAFL